MLWRGTKKIPSSNTQGQWPGHKCTDALHYIDGIFRKKGRKERLQNKEFYLFWFPIVYLPRIICLLRRMWVRRCLYYTWTFMKGNKMTISSPTTSSTASSVPAFIIIISNQPKMYRLHALSNRSGKPGKPFGTHKQQKFDCLQQQKRNMSANVKRCTFFRLRPTAIGKLGNESPADHNFRKQNFCFRSKYFRVSMCLACVIKWRGKSYPRYTPSFLPVGVLCIYWIIIP